MDQIQLTEAPDPVTPPPAVASDQASPESDPAPAQASSVDNCLRAATLADEAVARARTSLGNWQTHYGAQIAFDNGEIDGTEAKRRWVVSKEPAERNIDAFAEARDAMARDDPCADVQPDEVSDDELQQLQSCGARTAAAMAVMADTQPAMDDWLAHLKMMATRDQYAIDQYLEIWRQAVADAPAAIDTFDTAVQAYEEAGDCPTDRTATLEPVATPIAARSATSDEADTVHTCVLRRGRPRPAHANA
jgi:hypothetical protein